MHLLPRVLREVVAGAVADHGLVGRDQPAQVVDVEVDVCEHAAFGLELVELDGERLRVDAEHGGTEHLEQPAVGVEGEALTAAGPGQAGRTRR